MKTYHRTLIFAGTLLLATTGLLARPYGGGSGGGRGNGPCGGDPGVGMMGPGPGGPAGGGPGMGKGSPRDVEDRIQRLDARLNLSVTQKELARSIFTEYNKKMQDYVAKLPALNQELQKLLEEENVDLKAVRAKMDEIGKIHVEIRMLHVQQHIAFEKILNDNQKAILKKQWENRRGGPGGGPGSGRGMGPGR